MNFHPLLMYQVIYFDGGLLICAEQDVLQRPDAKPLMRGPADAVCEYLARHIHARERGMDLDAAHKKALEGAHLPLEQKPS